MIVGVPKAGTSSLARWLGAHPDIVMSADKELNFFTYRRDLGLSWYKSQFAGVDDAQAVGEASPTYVLYEESMADLAETVPEARGILLLRHPVDRAYSHYWYQRSLGFEPRSFDAAVADELDRPDRLLGFLHVGTGRYEVLVDRLDRHLPNRSLVLIFEDLRDRPDSVYREVCSFLGVRSEHQPPEVGAIVNQTTMLRSERLRYLMLKHRLSERVSYRLAHALDRWNRVSRPYPPMSAVTRERLLDHYRPTVDAVEARLGRPLPSWRT